MIYINGRFLTQKITGVQRYAIEITKELDKLFKKNEVCLLVPNDEIINEINLENIEILQIGKYKGHKWEQISLPLYVIKNKGKLLNLCNLAPILYPGYITIHDISFKTNNEHLHPKFVRWYKFVTRLNIKRYKHIFTDSNFSKKEIIDNYKINENKISITYCSADHLKLSSKDEDILRKYNLKKDSYFFSLGSNSKHKNFKYIYELAKKYPDKVFVVTGEKKSNIFNNAEDKTIDNLIFTGYLSDNQLAVLYSNCKAFIFPSLYEGFGIPPLEAVKMGCDYLILSNISVLKEIYGNNAVYVDATCDFNLPTKLKKADSAKLLQKYSWKKSAKAIYEILNKK